MPKLTVILIIHVYGKGNDTLFSDVKTSWNHMKLIFAIKSYNIPLNLFIIDLNLEEMTA